MLLTVGELLFKKNNKNYFFFSSCSASHHHHHHQHRFFFLSRLCHAFFNSETFCFAIASFLHFSFYSAKLCLMRASVFFPTLSILFISCHQLQSCRKIESLIISWMSIGKKKREKKMFLATYIFFLFLIINDEAPLTCFYQPILLRFYFFVLFSFSSLA